MSVELFAKTLERARKYRITDLETLQNIAWLYLQAGPGQVPLAEIDSAFREREAYQEGSLTDPPQLPLEPDLPADPQNHPKLATMTKELSDLLKYLRLGNLLARWEDYLKLAADKNLSPARWLTYVLEEEYQRKRENARQLRLKQAHLPEILVIETYPFERQPKLNQKRLLVLYDSQDYLQQHQNLIWLGRAGCGKTGLAISFLIHTIDQGYRGRYVLFTNLVDELYAAVADHSEARVLKKYLAFDILLIDEIGYVEVEPVQVGQFFTLMHERHRKKSTLLTSNLGFADWDSFLKNDHLTAALIDRLTENSHVINMKGCRTLRDPLNAEPCAEP